MGSVDSRRQRWVRAGATEEEADELLLAGDWPDSRPHVALVERVEALRSPEAPGGPTDDGRDAEGDGGISSASNPSAPAVAPVLPSAGAAE